MSELTNPNIITNFLKNDHRILIINKIDEQICYFYIFLIEFFTKVTGHKISIISDQQHFSNTNDDLFGSLPIFIFLNSSLNNLENFSKFNNKGIFFVDYKIYKKLSNKYDALNAYSYKKDIKFLLEKISINNKEIIESLCNSPAFTNSEISKLTVNKKNYFIINDQIKNHNDIAYIRKNYYQNKIKNNIIELYRLLKEEVDIKKFNFLTY